MSKSRSDSVLANSQDKDGMDDDDATKARQGSHCLAIFSDKITATAHCTASPNTMCWCCLAIDIDVECWTLTNGVLVVFPQNTANARVYLSCTPPLA